MKLRFSYLMLAIAALVLAIVIVPSQIFATPETMQAVQDTPNDERIVEIEQTWKAQYTDYLATADSDTPISGQDIRETLARLNAETQSHFALVYVFPQENHLELMLVIPGESPLHIVQSDVPLETFAPILADFQFRMSRPISLSPSLNDAQQLYQWIISPLEPTLADHAIQNLIFCVGAGVRSAPLAALHDGQQFLVERYGVSIIPAFSLTDTRYERVANTRILAMGASEFEVQNELPAVPVELRAIAQDLWNGDIFLNEDFTEENLIDQLRSDQFAIVHLATHAAFEPGSVEDSYIQLWQDEQLRLNELPDLGWSDRPIELLVLSACQTALGDRSAELGFAGLSYQTGVKSTLASLWSVHDLGTLALMREFYWHLAQPDVTTKAEALRRTQVAMIHGTVRIENGQIQGSGKPLALPSPLAQETILSISTPYHWAGFTLVGSPW